MKIGYLGPVGTFSNEACDNCFDETYEKIPYKTIKETIIALKNNDVDKCIIPVENSLQGCVTEAIDTLIQNENIYVEKEYILKINQNLMAKEKYNIEDIKIVYSHIQAISQCRNYLEENLKNAEIKEVLSTALGAKYSLENDYSACIGNISCIDKYGLKLIDKDIQDNNLNQTKFWILSKKINESFDKKKISIIFTTKHVPGALYKILGIFDKHNINLTKIESRPAKTNLGEYYFLVDFDIDKIDATNALKELKENANYSRILGIYN